MKARSGCLWTIFLVAVVGFSFLGGVVAFNFIMAYSVRHGKEITVPQLRGLTLEKAERVAGDTGLRVRTVGERFSARVPPGFVLEQNPPAARRVKRGRRISVIVSGGRETVRVPEVAGKPVRQAIVVLDGAGTEAGDVSESTSDRVDAGNVIASSPPAGSQVESGSRVDLLVSLGRPPTRFMMPNLVGREADLVNRYLEGLGTVVLRSRQSGSRGRTGPWTVVSQRPAFGRMVAEGDTVNLILGLK
jgi:beta-lactam-binding protein with PASTA domain